jgi:hypothetical protein
MQTYIESLETEYFIVFREKFACWLLACCEFNMFASDRYNYSDIISRRFITEQANHLALLAPEALQLYISFLDGSINNSEYDKLIQLYETYIANPDLLELANDERDYLTYCIQSEQYVRLTDLSIHIKKINKKKKAIETYIDKFTQQLNTFFSQLVDEINFRHSLDERVAYNEWYNNQRDKLIKLTKDAIKNNDFT